MASSPLPIDGRLQHHADGGRQRAARVGAVADAQIVRRARRAELRYAQPSSGSARPHQVGQVVVRMVMPVAMVRRLMLVLMVVMGKVRLVVVLMLVLVVGPSGGGPIAHSRRRTAGQTGSRTTASASVSSTAAVMLQVVLLGQTAGAGRRSEPGHLDAARAAVVVAVARRWDGRGAELRHRDGSARASTAARTSGGRGGGGGGCSGCVGGRMDAEAGRGGTVRREVEAGRHEIGRVRVVLGGGYHVAHLLADGCDGGGREGVGGHAVRDGAGGRQLAVRGSRGSSLISLASRKTTLLMTPLMCSSGQMPSRMRCGRPRPFGRRSVPPSIDGPSMLWTRFAYSTNVGYGMSYLRAACDSDRPSFSTLKMASAIVSGRQDFSGPRSRKRRWWIRFWLFQHFCHIDCS
uniref:Uncharacterized protein n=1 Tax=Anopheles atroparvus TaxID=41427 RepID=A0A182JKH1_ANOAO